MEKYKRTEIIKEIMGKNKLDEYDLDKVRIVEQKIQEFKKEKNEKFRNLSEEEILGLAAYYVIIYDKRNGIISGEETAMVMAWEVLNLVKEKKYEEFKKKIAGLKKRIAKQTKKLTE